MRPEYKRRICTVPLRSSQVIQFTGCGLHSNQSMNLIQCLRHIVKYEGASALFKGLGPNLVGVAPSRAIYFCAYSQAKIYWNTVFPPDTPIVHVCSAMVAGFAACTATNPIWFVKTRLQLDHKRSGKHMTAGQCIRRIYAQTVRKKCVTHLSSYNY